MTEPFRYLVLMANDHKEPNLITNKKKEILDDNAFH